LFHQVVLGIMKMLPLLLYFASLVGAGDQPAPETRSYKSPSEQGIK